MGAPLDEEEILFKLAAAQSYCSSPALRGESRVPGETGTPACLQGVIFLITTSGNGNGFVRKDVQIANIHGFFLFEGYIRLASVARLSNPSDVS